MGQEEKKDRGASATFKVGAVALVFMIIGYQAALFIYKASVTAIAGHRDRPDTVYVVDMELARRIISEEEGILRDPVLPHGGEYDDAPQAKIELHRRAEHSPEAERVAQKYAGRRYESFRFDPNTVSVEDLCRLGFTEKQASAIDNYRSRGGHFRRKEDFARSFVVADSVYRRLEKYIDIPLVDINKADSTAFDTLPGIGPFFASRMVSYRDELGGYSYSEQLMDIWKFDREKYDGLKDLITVGPSSSFRLWSLPEDSLKLHPYIRSYAAHGIVLFRSNSPREEWTVENLVKSGILKDEDGTRLARCRIESP